MAIEIKQIRTFDEGLVTKLFSRIGGKNIHPNHHFFEDEKNILLVAYTNAEPCGFLYGYLLESLRSKQPKLFLYSIDVIEQHRRKRVGTKLIEALKEIAREHSCHEIFVLTNRSNLAAMRLYETTGGSIENNDDVLFVYGSKRYS